MSDVILENTQCIVEISDHCHQKCGLSSSPSSSPSSYQFIWNMGKIWVGWRSNLCFIEVMARLIQRGRQHLVGTSQEGLRWLSILFLVSSQSEEMENQRDQDNILMVPQLLKQWKQCDRWKQCKQCKQCNQCRLDSVNSEITNFIWSVTNLFIYWTKVRSLPCLVSPSATLLNFVQNVGFGKVVACISLSC